MDNLQNQTVWPKSALDRMSDHDIAQVRTDSLAPENMELWLEMRDDAPKDLSPGQQKLYAEFVVQFDRFLDLINENRFDVCLLAWVAHYGPELEGFMNKWRYHCTPRDAEAALRTIGH